MESVIQELKHRIKKIEENIEYEVNKYNQALENIKNKREVLDSMIIEHESIKMVIEKLEE